MTAVLVLSVTATDYTDYMEKLNAMSMSTIIQLYNESIFHHIEQDIRNPDYLLACLDNAVTTVDLKGKKGWAIAGQPSIAGYEEGKGTEARFKTLVSLAQINKTTLILSDSGNGCLRSFNRMTGRTDTYAGYCSDQGSDTAQESMHLDDIRFVEPGPLLYDKDTSILYVIDLQQVYSIKMATILVKKIHEESKPILGFYTDIEDNKILATVSKGIVRLDLNAKLVTSSRVISGFEFEDLYAIVQPEEGIFLVAESGNSKLRSVEFTR